MKISPGKTISLPQKRGKTVSSRKKRKARGIDAIPSQVVDSILLVATVLAAVDGVYRAAEKAKLRSLAKILTGVASAVGRMKNYDLFATRIASMFSAGASSAMAFDVKRTGIDVQGCLGTIASHAGCIYPAFLSWISMCCCDSDYVRMERDVIARIRDVLARNHDVKLPPSFEENAEKHIRNLVYAEESLKTMKDAWRKENLKDVIAFEKYILLRMAQGKEY